jgi:hypothetical protein
LTDGKPIIGTASAAPTIKAGALESPKFLGTEAEYFKEARAIIENAKPGEIVGAQMYEFQNAATNPGNTGAPNAPGYADQQALLPALAAADKRGVNVQIILDASKDPKTHALNNQPIIDYLKKNAGDSGHLTLDLYPPNTVNIDHAKELFHMTKGAGGAYEMQEALAGGSNWGNHTPANDDGGAAMFGRDAVGAGSAFFRDQAFCRGDQTTAAQPANDPNAPVQWYTTSPVQEGGGSTGIKDQKLALLKEFPTVYSNQFCFNNPDLLQATEALGKGAHLRADPHEYNVNKNAVNEIRQSGGTAMWANTILNPDTMPGQIQHEKRDVNVDKNGVAQATTMGSANDTGNGLETTHRSDVQDGTSTEEKSTLKHTNHEIDIAVRRQSTNEKTADGGTYSTAAFLDAALAKSKDDLATKSLQDPPQGTGGNQPF